MTKFSSIKVGVISLVVMIGVGVFFWVDRSGGNLLATKTEKAIVRFEPIDKPRLNQPYKVKLVAFSPRDNFNSAGIYLRFDPMKLRVMDLDTLKSFCQFYPEKKFDNQLGSISMACGAPHPGVRGEVELMTITFLPLVEGSSQVLIDGKSALLGSDGKGTNILDGYPTLEVSPGVSL